MKAPAAKRPSKPAKKSRPVLAAEARDLLARDLENLRGKVARGTVLTPSERRLLGATLEGTAPSSGFGGNQVELADYLGVTRQTVHRWLRKEGNPGRRPDGRYSFADWTRWKDERGGSSAGSPTSTELKARLVAVQIEKIEYALAVARGEYWAVADVKKWCAELASAVRTVITRLHLVAPSVVGVSVAEAEARLKEVEDDVLRQLRQIGKTEGADAPPAA